MTVTLYSYPKCGTCQKAKKWLDRQNITYTMIHIAENPPSKEEIRKLHAASGLDLKKLFNVSGMKYRELGLKDILKEASEEEMLDILASDGMLLKRPIVTNGSKTTIGFNEEQFEREWL